MIKRIFCAMTALFVLSATGCEKQQSTVAISPVFCCDFSAEYGEIAYEGKFTADEASLRLEFNKPEAVKGLIFRTDGDELKMQYKKMSYTAKASSFPATAFAAPLFYAVRSVLAGGELSGSVQGVSYRVELRQLQIESITTPLFSVKLYNYK